MLLSYRLKIFDSKLFLKNFIFFYLVIEVLQNFEVFGIMKNELLFFLLRVGSLIEFVELNVDSNYFTYLLKEFCNLNRLQEFLVVINNLMILL